jgi:hypothetical protein
VTRTIPRRLKQLETRDKEVAAARPVPHTLCYISVDKKVVSIYEMATWQVDALRPSTGPRGIRADKLTEGDPNA